MWIQVRTIDGKETRTIDDLSRLTKIESLRLKIQENFNVRPEQQRLFYRGKQMEDGQTLFDYNVGLNDIVQLLIRSQTDGPGSQGKKKDKESGSASSISGMMINNTKKSNRQLENQPSTSARTFLIDPGIGVFKINELVDCRDVSIGAWFEATIENVVRANKGQNNKSSAKGGKMGKRTNGKLEVDPNYSSQDSNGDSCFSLDSGPSTSYTDFLDNEEDIIYHIRYDDYPESGIVEMCTEDVRPRARTILKWDRLRVGLTVMVNYNIEVPEERGFWFDAEITSLKEISRTNKEVRVKLFLGGPEDVINDCKIIFYEEIYKVEKPGAAPLTAADGHFKRKSGPECKHCKADPDAECRFCSCCVCGGKQDAHMQLLCDECNMAFHIYCLNPPLSRIPEDEDWYCPTCKNDTNEVVKAGEKLKQSKKKAKMPSAHTESQRDWGKGMACVGRTKECTIVPSNHYGPIPGVPVGTTWKFRVQVSEAGVHRPHVGGIHGRSNDGSYSLVLAGGFEDEVDRGDEFTYTGSGGRDLSGNKRIGEHSFDQTLTHMNRALALNCDAPLNDKNGAESKNWRAGKPVRVVRSSKGRRISKYAPEEGNRYDGIYKVVKYWPEIGKCGFLVWRYLLRRDDSEPAPWTSEGIDRTKKLGLTVQYPEGYLEAMANKVKKDKIKKSPVKQEKQERVEKKEPVEKPERETRSNGNRKRSPEKVIQKDETPAKTKRLSDKGEAFQLSAQQEWLIREDCLNKKLWDEALACLMEGPNFLRKVEQIFMCVCCQELVFQPVTTECLHNVCKTCLQRSFRAEVYTCPACRHDLGKDYIMVLNKILQSLLDQFFPGYSKGR
ncbi:E3 ubiquitin-protein ligase UHRF2-like [Erpetoichthys calabaricus]|uniref:E3 ubiquitin-protein ligase UHRF n=1 Tax=Erpetoichthys calabaricus TaxID=27687 RepID=A0A8C4S1X0_ERPCA|nr:E3 ubiquitin-protein ligase UHRF2-like [Erpetoichthys calabaricus]